MKDILSKNVQKVELSGIRKFSNLVSKYPGAISLTLGQPDFNVPSSIKNAMIEAIKEGKTTYTSNAGIIELREEICNYLKDFNINYSPEEICLTVGASEALMTIFTTIINPGDKLLIPTPAYPSYESIVKILGGSVINYSLDPEDFSIDIEKLEKQIIEEKPKAMVLSYPCNPTGAVLDKKTRDALYKIIKEQDIYVVDDEIYGSIVFQEGYYSICQYPEIRDKVILLNGFSKMFSMTGLRLGYICASQVFIDSLVKVHQYSVSCAPSISQYGALCGLRESMGDVRSMVSEYKNRRDYVYKRLVNLGMDVYLPEGAFYIFPSIKKFNMDSETFCVRLLKEAKVAVVPGSAFGAGGEGYMRISYSYSIPLLEEGLNRIENWVKQRL